MKESGEPMSELEACYLSINKRFHDISSYFDITPPRDVPYLASLQGKEHSLVVLPNETRTDATIQRISRLMFEALHTIGAGFDIESNGIVILPGLLSNKSIVIEEVTHAVTTPQTGKRIFKVPVSDLKQLEVFRDERGSKILRAVPEQELVEISLEEIFPPFTLHRFEDKDHHGVVAFSFGEMPEDIEYLLERLTDPSLRQDWFGHQIPYIAANRIMASSKHNKNTIQEIARKIVGMTPENIWQQVIIPALNKRVR